MQGQDGARLAGKSGRSLLAPLPRDQRRELRDLRIPLLRIGAIDDLPSHVDQAVVYVFGQRLQKHQDTHVLVLDGRHGPATCYRNIERIRLRQSLCRQPLQEFC